MCKVFVNRFFFHFVDDAHYGGLLRGAQCVSLCLILLHKYEVCWKHFMDYAETGNKIVEALDILLNFIYTNSYQMALK